VSTIGIEVELIVDLPDFDEAFDDDDDFADDFTSAFLAAGAVAFFLAVDADFDSVFFLAMGWCPFYFGADSTARECG
jgi:hypothetical protein